MVVDAILPPERSYIGSFRAEPVERVAAWSLLVVMLLAGCAGSGPRISRTTEPGSESPDPQPSAMPGGFGSELIDTGYRGAEPTIGIDNDGAVYVTAFDHVLKSSDDGLHWNAVHTYTRPGVNASGFATLDPYLFVDVEGGRVLVNHLRHGPNAGELCTFLAISGNGGLTWTEREQTCPAQDVDHNRVAGAGLGPSTGVVTGLTSERPVYLCYSTARFVRDNQCATSFDDGATWENHQTVITRSRHSCGGLGGAPLVASDNTFAIIASFACKGPIVAFTRDNGETWSTSKGPQDPEAGHSMDPEAAFDAQGGVVAVYRRSDQRVHMARLSSLGGDWQGPWQLAPAKVGSTVFETIAVSASGRIGVAFLGSEDSTERPGSAPNSTRWHLYAGVGELGSGSTQPAIQVHRLTPASDPVQVGPICVASQACPKDARNLLDFIDSAFSPAGDYFVAYTDGCTTPSCREAGHDDASRSREQRVMVARVPA